MNPHTLLASKHCHKLYSSIHHIFKSPHHPNITKSSTTPFSLRVTLTQLSRSRSQLRFYVTKNEQTKNDNTSNDRIVFTVPIKNQNQSNVNSLFFSVIRSILVALTILSLGALFFQFYIQNFLSESSKRMSSVTNMIQGEWKHTPSGDINVKLDDIIGIDDCRDEIEEVIQFLRNRERYKLIGAKMPKGILLTGEPGTGKTMLAKAIANEAEVNFFYASGSQFDEIFVGIGAVRVKQLFTAARKQQPCIVFIDELDTIGQNRKNFYSNRQTLNQLLAELDGMMPRENVLFIGATNLQSMVDPALLRPGRLDRIISVPLPDLNGRRRLFENYLEKKSRRSLLVPSSNEPIINPDIKLDQLARITVGMSGAQIESIVNEAAIFAAKHNQKSVTMKDLENAMDRVTMGVEFKNRRVTPRDLLSTATHEMGHAIVNLLTGGNVRKVTVIPRGDSVGSTSFIPDLNSEFEKKHQLLSRIDSALAGVIAEEIIFGRDHISIGAVSDMQKATSIAYTMVARYGMSERVPPAYLVESQDRIISNKMKRLVDIEVESIISQSSARVRKLLLERKDDLQRLSKYLLENETITGDELKRLLGMDETNDEESNRRSREHSDYGGYSEIPLARHGDEKL